MIEKNKNLKESVITVENRKFIFASLFLLANKLQTVGDRWDETITFKQWLLLIMIIQFKGSYPTLTETAELIGTSRQNMKQLVLKL